MGFFGTFLIFAMVTRSGPGALLYGSFCISFLISAGEPDSVRSWVGKRFRYLRELAFYFLL